MNNSNHAEFTAPDPLTVEVTYTHPRGEVAITMAPVWADDDGNVWEWTPVAIRVASGYPLTSQVMRDLPMGSIAAQVLEEHPHVDTITGNGGTQVPETTEDKVQAAADAWHRAREHGWKVIPHVRRAIGGLSEARATHYIRQARSAGLIPEEGRRGPAPRSTR